MVWRGTHIPCNHFEELVLSSSLYAFSTTSLKNPYICTKNISHCHSNTCNTQSTTHCVLQSLNADGRESQRHEEEGQLTGGETALHHLGEPHPS